MLVFIPNIPENSTQEELCSLVIHAFQGGWPRPVFGQWRAEACDILEIHDQDADTLEYHGLIKVQDERAGQTLIKQLRGAEFKGRRITAKDYQIRNQQRERRRALPENNNLAIIDRRQRDRRRPNLRTRTVFGELTA